MNNRPQHRPLVSAQGILTFTALSQIVLYLWVTSRITGALATSALAGVLLFGILVRAVREVMADHVPDMEDFGPITDWPKKPAGSRDARAQVSPLRTQSPQARTLSPPARTQLQPDRTAAYAARRY